MATRPGKNAMDGARKVVGACLGLLPGQELLIFCDENTLDTATLIHEAAVEQQVYVTILFIPFDDQIRLGRLGEFPLLIQATLRDAKAILTCVSDQPEAMTFRANIIRTAKNYQTKIGHCPGINQDMLATGVNVDYSALIGHCNLLAMALVKCDKATIVTYDSQNKPHELTVSLIKWDRVPVTGTGIIREGIWGNIPGGETYLAPKEDLAEGEYIVNGSIPGYVFLDGQEIMLTFEKGKISAITPAEHPGAKILQAKIDTARLAGDSNCDRLAEIGIGVNPGVKELTGKPLIDEKMAGTAHIALGSNKDFGGNQESAVHLDIVSRGPSLTADGKSILKRGELVILEPDWRSSYTTIKIPKDWTKTMEAVSRAGHKANPRSPRLLERELIDGTGRVLCVSVGDNLTASAAKSIYDRIPKRERISISDLMAEVAWNRTDLLKLLKVMQDYEMVRLHQQGS